jgi:hypothetical protein
MITNLLLVGLCSYQLTNYHESNLERTDLHALKETLLTNYRADTIPIQYEPLNLSMGIAFRAFNNIDQKEGIVSLNLWLRYIWNDYNLRWNVSEWNNISSLTMRTDPQLDGSIWTPDIYLYNTGENPLENLKWSNVKVDNDGQILWSRPGIIQSTCSFDMTHFPYDIQECYFKFGSWAYTGSHLKLVDMNPTIDLSNYQDNEEWEILNVSYNINSIKYACCLDEYYDITFSVNLKRLTGYYETNVIIPTFATASLVLITLLIPWDSGERISFAVTVMLSIIVFLLILSDTLPKSNQQPILSRMIMSLTFFSLFGVFFTVLISALNSYKNEKIDDKGKIDSKIVRLLYNICKVCCVFNDNSCKKTSQNDIESTISNNSLHIYDQNNSEEENLSDDSTLGELKYRTQSYNNATNSLTRRVRNVTHITDLNEITNTTNLSNNLENNKIEKEILQDDCNKMINILETIYSLAFLITFISLCIIMFTSKQ